VQERDASGNVLATYTRGLDLSGTFGGAGGIGGLLARTDSSGSAYYHGDVVGNITSLTDGNGNAVARYLHDPFGRALGMSGPLAAPNAMRSFSMPYYNQPDVVGYPLRVYDTRSHGWTSEDPIREAGGINLHQFVGNNPMSNLDPLGLAYAYTSTAQGVSSMAQEGVPGPLPYVKSEGWGNNRLIDYPIGLVNNVLSTVGNTLYQLVNEATKFVFPNANDQEAAGLLLATTPIGWPENAALLSKLSKLQCAAEEGQMLFRGVPGNGTQKAILGQLGIAVPRGTALDEASLIKHVLGEDVNAGVTSWTTERGVAARFSGPDGTIIEAPLSKVSGQIVPKPPVPKYGAESEVLLRGTVQGTPTRP